MRPLLISLALLLAFDASSQFAPAAADVPKTVGLYLDLEGITGDSDDADFKGQIELTSFSLAGQRSEKDGDAAKLADFFVLKALDIASPKLLAALANGQKFAKATVTVRGGKEPRTLQKAHATAMTR